MLPLMLLATTTVANRVWVVDTTGAGNFTRIGNAIAAAADGDTILIKSGTYPGFTVDGMTLAVVGDEGADVRVIGPVVIQNLTGRQQIVMGGFEVATLDVPALRSTNNDGPVRILDSRFQGYPEAVLVENCPDLSFSECHMAGRNGPHGDLGGYFGDGYPGGNGLRAVTSRLALHDCTLQGGDGGDGRSDCNTGGGDGGRGGEGCSLMLGFLYAANVWAHGGAGGDGRDCDCIGSWQPGWGENGGHGISLASSEGKLMDCVALGGAPGMGGCDSSCSCSGFDGVAGTGISGFQVEILQGPSRRLAAPLVLREGHSVTLEFLGSPGDVVRLSLARTTAFEWSPPYRSVLLVPPATFSLEMGRANLAGVLRKSALVPGLDTGEQSRVLFLQASHDEPWPDGLTLGSGRSLVVVGQGF